MTKIQPLTSEEVLVRQVNEARSTSVNPAIGEDMEDTPHGVLQPMTPAVPAKPVNPAPTGGAKDKKRDTLLAAGYNHRLPIGSYLLSFMYFEVLVGLLVFAALKTAGYMQSGVTEIEEALKLVGETTWIAIVVSGMMSIFIASANSTLRWFAIAGASIVAVVLAYPVVTRILSDPSAALAIGTEWYMYVLGVALCLGTILYLSLKKVAVAYE